MHLIKPRAHCISLSSPITAPISFPKHDGNDEMNASYLLCRSIASLPLCLLRYRRDCIVVRVTNPKQASNRRKDEEEILDDFGRTISKYEEERIDDIVD